MENATRRDRDLEARVGRWRRRQERTSSLSPRELDELEDHLRARVDLEIETNTGLAPNRAFAIALEELGKSVALSSEFAKAGKPRWWKLLVVGWAMYAVSFFMPAFGFEFDGASGVYGYDVALRTALEPLSPSPFLNFAMLMTIPAFWNGGLAGRLWLRRFLGLGGLAALCVGKIVEPVIMPDIGYWTWAASLVCSSVALRIRARDWVPAELQSTA